jgi:hypothetical protein
MRKQLYFYWVKFARYLIGLLPAAVSLGCSVVPEVSWDLLQTSADQLTICQGRVCPKLTVTYPNFKTQDSILGARLGKITDSLVIEVLYLGSDRPNYGLSIQQSIKQYLWVGLDYKTELLEPESYDGMIKIDASRQNDSILIIELNSQLILPEGQKTDKAKRRINLKE